MLWSFVYAGYEYTLRIPVTSIIRCLFRKFVPFGSLILELVSVLIDDDREQARSRDFLRDDRSERA